jgi:hypothetical protein
MPEKSPISPLPVDLTLDREAILKLPEHGDSNEIQEKETIYTGPDCASHENVCRN